MSDGDSSVISLQEAVDRYLSEVSSKLSPDSHSRDERLGRMLLKGLDGELPLSEVSPRELDDYRQKRLKDASAATVAKDFVFLSSLYDTAIEKWQLDLGGNPVNSLGTTARTHGRDRRLRHGEKMRLLAACDKHSNPLLGWVVRIALETAMRKSEILALKEADVDLGKRLAIVPKTQAKAPRPVPLTQVAVQVFKEVIANKERPADSKLLFYGDLGRYDTRRPYAIDRIFRQLLLTARMKAFKFADLRHEAISRLQEAGLNELEIIAIAGTRAIRGRRQPQQQPEALVKRLDALGIGLDDGDAVLVRKKTRKEPADEEPVGSSTNKRGVKRGNRGSFGVAVGVRGR